MAREKFGPLSAALHLVNEKYEGDLSHYPEWKVEFDVEHD